MDSFKIRVAIGFGSGFMNSMENRVELRQGIGKPDLRENLILFNYLFIVKFNLIPSEGLSVNSEGWTKLFILERTRVSFA